MGNFNVKNGGVLETHVVGTTRLFERIRKDIGSGEAHKQIYQLINIPIELFPSYARHSALKISV